MKILIVFAHPEPTSFNHALLNVAVNTFHHLKHEMKVSDLYRLDFNPVASWGDFKKVPDHMPLQYGIVQSYAHNHHQFIKEIAEEQKKLMWCDLVIFQFPFWWYSMPALLKGWMDRVFAAGFAYDKDKVFKNGLLAPRRALLSITTQSPASAYASGGAHGKIESYLHPIHHTLELVGLTPLPSFIAYGVMDMSASEREHCLHDFKQYLAELTSSTSRTKT